VVRAADACPCVRGWAPAMVRERSVMRSTIAALVMSVMMVVGCEAVPDGDDYDHLREMVAGAPQGVLDALRVYASNRIAYGWWLSREDSFEKVGEVMCDEQLHDVVVRDVLFCLNRYKDWSYSKCLDNMGAVYEYDLFKGNNCNFAGVEPRYHPDKMPKEFEAERVGVDAVVQALLGPPPPVKIQLLLIGAGGFVGPAGVLCPMGADWACPENPLNPGDTSSSAATGGGDR
jgi:hypothetical protein